MQYALNWPQYFNLISTVQVVKSSAARCRESRQMVISYLQTEDWIRQKSVVKRRSSGHSTVIRDEFTNTKITSLTLQAVTQKIALLTWKQNDQNQQAQSEAEGVIKISSEVQTGKSNMSPQIFIPPIFTI